MSWLLALVLLMTMLPTAALAAEAPGTSSGTVIYVSENGNDSAAGDENTPLKTIGEAFTRAADGGTIYLLSDIVLPSETVLSGDKSITLAVMPEKLHLRSNIVGMVSQPITTI